MRTEAEIKKKYQEVFQENNLTEDFDDRLIIYSELRMLKWVLKEEEQEGSVE